MVQNVEAEVLVARTIRSYKRLFVMSFLRELNEMELGPTLYMMIQL